MRSSGSPYRRIFCLFRISENCQRNVDRCHKTVFVTQVRHKERTRFGSAFFDGCAPAKHATSDHPLFFSLIHVASLCAFRLAPAFGGGVCTAFSAVTLTRFFLRKGGHWDGYHQQTQRGNDR
jgi:hypothetical protein